ncbi:MAG: DUF1236 domain-containing protein [Aliihoeflea sp.]|uniref:DUF1236 domain-containing protein n=1 Tax=Aliihoeflea sp. TaxID=2608088 RepID=UPI004037C3A9
MRKFLLATAAIAALSVGAAHAQTSSDDSARGFGATAGGTTGAVAGAVVGGPIGAIVGGFAGAVIGAETAVPDEVVGYVVDNPVPTVTYEGEIAAGAVIPAEVEVVQVPDSPEYGYIYVNGRPVLVEYESREVVYSPGYVVPERTVTYITENPADPVVIDAEISTGAILPADVQIIEVPEDPYYGYVYTEQGPIVVERGTREVIWVE